MNRRDACLGLAAMFGNQLLAPIARALAAGFDAVAMTGASLFTSAERADAAVLAEIIIPTTDTPGARDAGVPEFIEFMLQEWYADEERLRFRQALATLGAHCSDAHGDGFHALAPDVQTAIVQDLQDGGIPQFPEGGRDFFEHLKQLTVFGYYTSKIGMTIERRYLPVPGHFDGAYPYEQVGTLFSS